MCFRELQPKGALVIRPNSDQLNVSLKFHAFYSFSFELTQLDIQDIVLNNFTIFAHFMDKMINGEKTWLIDQ